MAADDQKYVGPVAFVNDPTVVPWGRGDGRGSIVGQIAATNGFAQDAIDEARKAQRPYQVVRRKSNAVDYIFGEGRFRQVYSPDDYHFLISAGFIGVPHGTAPVIEDNLLDFIQRECAAAAVNPKAVEAINPPPVLG